MTQLIDITVYPVKDVLPILLKDDATGKNVVFATDSYVQLGDEFLPERCITPACIAAINPKGFQPRINKQTDQQAERTRKKAEVFTPAWICCKMNNFCDEQWFNGECPFNVQYETSWRALSKPVPFPNAKAWQKYVDSRRLEITCGEAPFLASRYDAATGNIIPVSRRIGILDRKLRVVSENAQTETDWLNWALRALQSVYGYEMQGDSLLIARINLLATFADFLAMRWGRLATTQELKQAARIISRNVWQMDGLSAAVPFYEIPGDNQLSLFDDFELQAEPSEKLLSPKIKNWRAKKILEFRQLIKSRGKDMKFDFVIGNPPYQETTDSESTKMPPIYNLFMDAAYQIADKVELITPGRFLFRAGATPSEWNEKMLSDKHLKVLHFEHRSSNIFANTDIKGGIVITFHDNTQDFGAIEIFCPFEEMRSIRSKAAPQSDKNSLFSIIYNQNKFDLEKLYKDYPEFQSIIGSNGRDKRFRNNIFEKISIFAEKRKKKDDLPIIGLIKNKRVWRYFPKRYIDISHENLSKWKVLVPSANGSGAIGEVMSTPLCGPPLCGYTQSFIGIGSFDTEEEANNCLKYVKSKFARVMLGILKITQHNPPETWRLVPLQDFTSSSDIDWSLSISEIDAQLYKKYKLTKEEIAFIESNVKEMS